MPVKQKKAQEAPTHTLHHFFNATPILPSQSKDKRTTKSRLKTNPSAGKPPSVRSSSQHEIIVIESDSDDEVEIVETTSVKRRKLTPKNSGNSTCSIKTEHSPTSKHSSSKENEGTVSKKGLSNQSDDSLSFGQPFLLVNGSSSVPSEEPSATTFGEPVLLKAMPTTSTAELHSTYAAGTSTNSSDVKTFGEPFLLRSSTINNEYDVSSNPIKVPGSSSSFHLEAKCEDLAAMSDDWENGDDERDPETFAEDEVEPDWTIDEPQEQKDSIMDIEMSDSNTKSTSIETNAKSVLTSEKRASGSRADAFSVLMTSFKENEVWKEATVADDRNFRPTKSNGSRRHAPFYKVLQGMPIAVDAFKYGAIPSVTAYFLTHAHSDHYTNLSSKWNNGPIYCSEGTANLIVHMLSVDKKWVHPLPMDIPTTIPNTGGVTVTLIEANHCPGSCLFFFEGRQTVNAGDSTFKSSHVGSLKVFRYLHCGDFRASPYHILHPAVKDKVIDHVYLDTTYLDPKYTFPPQPLVISACADLAKRAVNGDSLKEKNSSSVLSWVMGNSDPKGKGKERRPSRPLIVIGTYSIGKERIAKAVAFALNTKIYCDARKMAILKCQADPQLQELLTSNPEEGHVHLIPLSSVSTDQLELYLKKFKNSYDTIIGFRPTGWTYTQPAGTNQSPSVTSILSASITSNYTFADLQLSPRSTATLQLYPVPYSEHSSFHELTCFAMSFNWKKMIATVNVGSEKSRGKMAKWVDKWEVERRKRGKDTIVPHRHPDYW